MKILHPTMLDRTVDVLAKMRLGYEDPEVTALSEAIKGKLGVTAPLEKPTSSPSPGFRTLAACATCLLSRPSPDMVGGGGGRACGAREASSSLPISSAGTGTILVREWKGVGQASGNLRELRSCIRSL